MSTDVPSRTTPAGTRRRRKVLAISCALAMLVGACSSDRSDGDVAGDQTTTSAPGQVDGPCPTVVDEEQFSSAEEMRDLLAEFNSFGLRAPGTDAHEASLDWLGEQLEAVPGMKVEWDEYEMHRWQPTTEAEGDTPGLDLAAAGGLTVQVDGTPEVVEVIGAVPFSMPTGEAGATGQLVHIGPDDEITPENAAGKVVVREIEHSSLPAAAFDAIGHHVTDDIDRSTDYDRPYLRPLDQSLVDAGLAGAAGLILVWDAPTDQLSGYWDPHTGTEFHVPAVYIGSDTVDGVLAAADAGASAEVVVRAEWENVPTRNLIATLPGGSRERIVVNTNTDSVNWVQENGTIAAIALARYLGSLPSDCRSRDVQFALTSNHLGFTGDGTFYYGRELDDDYDEGTVAFVMAPEHLGTREILPIEGDPEGRLEFTGEDEMLAWSAPDESPALVEATVEAVKRRELTRTVVLKGVGVPSQEHIPSICSQGGLGTNFHGLLIPTIAGISGPWSLWAPQFGEDAIDFDRMRIQTIAFGDIAVQLDDVSLEEIAGEYPEMRARRAEGAVTCPLDPPPAVAPTP